MQKKNRSNLFKKIICAFLLSLSFITSGSIVAYAVGSVEAGVYRLNALDETQYTELISSYSFSSSVFGVGSNFNFYDVNSNLIVSNSEYNSEGLLAGFGKDSTNNNLSSYFIWQDLEEVSWHYFAGEKTNSSLTVINNWYYIELLEDVTTFSTSVLDKFFAGSSATPLLVKTELGSDLPGDTPTESDISPGTYKINYNFFWPLTETVEFTGGLLYNGVSYDSLFIGQGEIYLLSKGTTATQKQIMNNYQWLVGDFTFTTSEGLYNTNDIHNAVESFNSQVNGTLNNNLGLSLGSVQYTFKSTIDYNILGYVEFDMTFKTGLEYELTYNYMYYSAVNDTLYYGGKNEENIVYQQGVWTNTIYQNFYCDALITNYAVGNFLAQNLDIYNLAEKYYIKGYYYFNDSLLVDDLLDLTFLTDFSYIHKGTIYNSFLPDYNVVTNNGVVTKHVISLSYYNTNTKKSELLLSGSYTSHSEYINTNDSSRQIYISPTLVNYDTYTWLNDNGLWIYYNDSDNTEFGDLMLVFPDVVIHFLASVLSFELFGIDVFTAICSILTVVLAVWLIRKLL